MTNLSTVLYKSVNVTGWLDPEVHPQTEDYWGRVNPIGPRACHDEGKRISETLSYAYEKQVSLLSCACTVIIYC